MDSISSDWTLEESRNVIDGHGAKDKMLSSV